jgi:ATP-binding cassette subfamily B protein
MQTENYSGDIPNKPWGFMWYVSQPYKWWFFVTVLIVVTAAVLNQSTSYLYKLIVDAAEAGKSSEVIFYALLYPVAILIVQLLFRLSSVTGIRFITPAMKHCSDVLSEYTLQHSDSYYANRFSGSILTKFGNVVGGIGQIVPDFFWNILGSFTSFVVAFGFMLTVNLYVAGIFLVLVLVMVILNYKLSPQKRKLSRAHAASRSKLVGRTADVLTNVAAARQYVGLEQELFQLKELTTGRLEAHQRTWKYSEKTRLVNAIVLFFATSSMFYILVTSWQAGEATTGELVLILTLVSQVAYNLTTIGKIFDSFSQAFGEMEEGLNDIFVDHEIMDIPNAITLTTSKGQITFDRTTFSYDSETVFEDLNLVIEPGQRVGLVGPSGAGKSTLVSLLLRQHNLNQGAILIDGQNIAEVTQDSLRASIALVPQEPMLFHRSIRENIMYGKPTASHEELVQAAERAQARGFIEALPEQYDTLVGERGVKLSGGQKQRVAIARAMLKEAPILVLDEATSALDSESEVAIQKALEELMEGKTVIAVAHRLSTLRKMDRILVIEAGKIVEDGTHETLTEAGGLYARLWNHQAGGFLQE